MTSTLTTDTELAAVIRAYNEVTERLKRSHESLAREVCRLRDELQEKNRALERRERLASLGQMAAGVAHEIRNPLGGIGLYASLLERDLGGMPKELEYVRKMAVGVRNLETIVSDILAFAGEMAAQPGVGSLAGILERAHIQVAPQADVRGVRVERQTSNVGVEVRCDADQIERAVINLLLNAIDAAGRGGHVWVGWDAPDESRELCRVIVEDDGPGIPTEFVHRVFDPFFTTKDTGTGLGLAIVHRIAEVNGGFISAGERPGGGARFVLSVPLAE